MKHLVTGGSGTIGNGTNPLSIRAKVIADGPTSVIHLLGNPLSNLGVTTESNGGKIVLGP